MNPAAAFFEAAGFPDIVWEYRWDAKKRKMRRKRARAPRELPPSDSVCEEDDAVLAAAENGGVGEGGDGAEAEPGAMTQSLSSECSSVLPAVDTVAAAASMSTGGRS